MKYDIEPPYFSIYSMSRSGMSVDPQQGYNVFLTGNWERCNFQSNCLFIKSGFNSSQEASDFADKLNDEILPILNEIVDAYYRHYIAEGLGNSRVIVRRDTDGRLGWSFDKAEKPDGEWLTRGDIVTLADGRTEATVLFVFDNKQLKNKLVRLGR